MSPRYHPEHDLARFDLQAREERLKRHRRQIEGWERRILRDEGRVRQRRANAFSVWAWETTKRLIGLIVLALVLLHAALAHKLGCR